MDMSHRYTSATSARILNPGGTRRNVPLHKLFNSIKKSDVNYGGKD